jgi:undecaprenyl diphosphate synthase
MTDVGINAASLPRHIAIVMDGNGRWAQGRGLPRTAGHRAGAQSVRRVVQACHERGIEVLTLFAFSSENWQRPAGEVRLLLDLFVAALRKDTDRVHEHNIRLRMIGDRNAFPRKLQNYIRRAETLTADNTGLNLVIAANYGGRWDVLQAVRRLLQDAHAGQIDPATLSHDDLSAYISLNDLPEPDLFIRTGGEQRISNFLLWQLAYTEFYFTDRLWPEFDAPDLDQALAAYAGRQRRFGRLAEQVEFNA